MQMQSARPEWTAKPGVAFSLAHELSAFDHAANSSPSAALPPDPRVEVVVLLRNDPVSGLRVLRPAQQSGWRSNAVCSRAASCRRANGGR